MDTQTQKALLQLEKAHNELLGQVHGIIAILEEMDGLPKLKREQIKQKLSGLMTPIGMQGNIRSAAETVVSRVLKG
jgi:hypothetical protein